MFESASVSALTAILEDSAAAHRMVTWQARAMVRLDIPIEVRAAEIRVLFTEADRYFAIWTAAMHELSGRRAERKYKTAAA